MQRKNSPHLEIFRKKGIEVLLLSDRIDEWLMSHLTEFDGKSFADVAKGELDLGDVEDEAEKKSPGRDGQGEGRSRKARQRSAERWRSRGQNHPSSDRFARLRGVARARNGLSDAPYHGSGRAKTPGCETHPRAQPPTMP